LRIVLSKVEPQEFAVFTVGRRAVFLGVEGDQFLSATA
jgi:hypothetical protein